MSENLGNKILLLILYVCYIFDSRSSFLLYIEYFSVGQVTVIVITAFNNVSKVGYSLWFAVPFLLSICFFQYFYNFLGLFCCFCAISEHFWDGPWYIYLDHSENSYQCIIQQQQQRPFNGLWSWTTRVGRYQKKHSPTHTHPDHRASFITFLHL